MHSHWTRLVNHLRGITIHITNYHGMGLVKPLHGSFLCHKIGSFGFAGFLFPDFLGPSDWIRFFVHILETCLSKALAVIWLDLVIFS